MRNVTCREQKKTGTMKLVLVRKRKMNEEVQYNTDQREGKPAEDGLKFPVLQKMRYEKKLLFFAGSTEGGEEWH